MPGGALLLAAGASRRFGSDKRTHTLASGELLLHATLEKYLATFDDVAVVLRQNDPELARILGAEFKQRLPRIIHASHAHLGMGHSLAAGVSAIDDWDYAFIALADMPFIKTATLTLLKDAMASSGPLAIIQPTFQGTPGHPVGFGNHHFAALKALTGDTGARHVVTESAQQVIEIAVNDNGVLRDVDQPSDLTG